VERQPISSIVPIISPDALDELVPSNPTKSPTLIGLSDKTFNPAKKFESVPCKANPIAIPPTPKVATRGVISIL